MILRDACKIAVFPSAFALALATCAPSPAFAFEGDDSPAEVTTTASEVTSEDETQADTSSAGAAAEQVGADEAGTETGTPQADGVNDASSGSVDDATSAQPTDGGSSQTPAGSTSDAVEVVRAGVTAAVRDFDPESSSAIIAVGLGVCAGATVGNCLSRGLDRWSGAPVVSHE